MILIDGEEILTVIEGFNWSGARDICTRTLSFSFLYNPLRKGIPKYKMSIGSRVEWIDEGKTRFLGYIESMPYNTDDDTISLTCQDLSTRLIRSYFVGRMKGTLSELANKICAIFGIKNGIKTDSKHIHNIVSEGDLTYYDVLKTACNNVFNEYTLYMDGDTLSIANTEVVDTFEIGYNIRSSNFSQSMSEMVNKVLIISNEGQLMKSIEDKDLISKYGLFQETYNYNKDCKDNLAEAQKLIKGVQNEGSIVCNNNNDVFAGKYIKINEPVNGFKGIFLVESDNHSIGLDKNMTLEVKYVKAG